MNKILKLFDKDYVEELFKKEILPLYPEFKNLRVKKINTYKDGIWEKTYHVVLEFRTVFISSNGKKVELPIFCSAHSEEPRKNVYIVLKYLWERGFGQGYLTIPHPLFYSDFFRGTFYRGVEGKHLYHFIKQNDLETVEEITAKAALWFVKLHSLDTEDAINFNKENSRIETIFPGIDHILFRIKEKHPEYYDVYRAIYATMTDRENKFLNSTKDRWLVHGDAHPENIIKMGKQKIAVIDFTDLCLSDFTRDIGTFLQQLDFMCGRKIMDTSFAEKVKKIFLDTYFTKSKFEFTADVQKRIDTYYNYTAIRTATFFLLKDDSKPKRAFPLVEMVKKNLL